MSPSHAQHMPAGIRATIAFTNPDVCPVFAIADAIEAQVHSVSRSVNTAEEAVPVTDFSLAHNPETEVPLEPIFSHGSTHRYRLRHKDAFDCPCECLGSFNCPIARYDVRDGTLTIVFYASDYEQLQRAIGDLRERFPDVDIKRFIQSPTETTHQDSVFVDRGRLTARQQEVLRTAYEKGYFDRPRGANATEIAAFLGIDASTFSEHLAAAQAKLFEDIFEDGP